MEDCPDTVQRDPHARPPALAQLGTQSDEEPFDVRPSDIGSDGIFVDGLKSPALLGAQPHSVIIRHYGLKGYAGLDMQGQRWQISVMRTTLRLDDELYRQAKAQAVAQGISLTKLVEQAIGEYLDRTAPRRRRLRLPVSMATGGLVPGFSSLEEAVEATDLVADQSTAG